ncbi:MAG TPA: hypothetical protein VJZ27_07865, partial [Aggregatilineales bacterium]|nr:hypothetical protein [Aggregatilineales bacterium]
LGGHVVVILLVLLGEIPVTALLVFVTLPETVRLCRSATSTEDASILHLVLVHTARLHMFFGVSYVVGWVLGEIF